MSPGQEIQSVLPDKKKLTSLMEALNKRSAETSISTPRQTALMGLYELSLAISQKHGEGGIPLTVDAEQLIEVGAIRLGSVMRQIGEVKRAARSIRKTDPPPIILHLTKANDHDVHALFYTHKFPRDLLFHLFQYRPWPMFQLDYEFLAATPVAENIKTHVVESYLLARRGRNTPEVFWVGQTRSIHGYLPYEGVRGMGKKWVKVEKNNTDFEALVEEEQIKSHLPHIEPRHPNYETPNANLKILYAAEALSQYPKEIPWTAKRM